MDARTRRKSAPASVKVREVYNRGEFSESEDVQLYSALLQFGPLDLENLKRIVPSRSEVQIKQRILTLQKKAQASLNTVSKKLRNGAVKLENRDKVALDKWLEKLYVLHQKEQILHGSAEELPVRMLARLMGYIAKYENHPSPDECEGVNLKNVYDFIESMMMGLPSKTLQSPDARFLLEGLQNLSSTMDTMDLGREMGFIHCQRPEWRLKGKASRTYGRVAPKESEFPSILSSSQYNPFNVPVEWLKRTQDPSNAMDI